MALPCEALPLEGEHDCCLGFPLETAPTEDDLTLGAPGRALEAEVGLCGKVVLKFGGASSEKAGTSDDFKDLDFTVGELPRDGMGFFELEGPDFGTEEDRPGGADSAGVLDDFGGRVGVADLDVVLVADTEGLPVGVEERVVGLEGVEDRTGGATGLADGKVVREFGVEDLDGLVDEGNVGRPVGVADLRGAAVCSLDGEDLLLLMLEEEFGRDGNVGCLDAFWFSEAGSNLMFASLDFGGEESRTLGSSM